MLTKADKKVTQQFLKEGSAVSNLINAKDWSLTPLGPIEKWPQSLKTSVNLILHSQHPMWIGWGPEITFLYNDAYIKVLSEAKHPWALGRPVAEVWEEIWDVCGPFADKVFQSGEATYLEDVRLFLRRGSFTEETYYSFSYSPIYDESGKVAGLFCPSAETTPKVLHTRRLRTLSELSSNSLLEKTTLAACASAFSTIRKNADDIPFALLYLVDNERMVAHLSQDTRTSGGADDLFPRMVFLNGSDHQQNSFWQIADVANSKRTLTVNLEHVNGLPPGCDGSPVSEAIVLPVSLQGFDTPIGILVAGVSPCRKLENDYQTFFDLMANQIAIAVQNARAAEEERKRMEMLAEIDKAKTAFFSNVSHEFRTPLTLMLGPVESILKESIQLLPKEHQEGLQSTHRNAMRLYRLVNTLLDFSRIEAGKISASFSKVDLCTLTNDLASNFRSVIERSGLTLNVHCEPLTVPVFVDTEMWEKIVFNLISNAYKYTLKGQINVQMRQEGDHAVFSVRDTGIGIPGTELPKIFDRFHRVRNVAGRTFEGTGIGLSLVKELVNLHGGSISAESAEGEGTTFTVRIPMGKDHLARLQVSDAPPVEQGTSLADVYLKDLESLLDVQQNADDSKYGLPDVDPGLAPDLKAQRILVVDDNADMRHYIRRLLSTAYDVAEAENGQDALLKLELFRPSLIISDIMMPVMDGIQLLHAVKNKPALARIPVILLSARAGEEARIEGYNLGADDYLVKPFSANELVARVKAQIRIARIRQNAENHVRNFFKQAPVTIVVFRGPDFVIEIANEKLLEYWGKTIEQVMYKPLLEVLPEIANQGLTELLTRVRTTGERHVEDEREVPFFRNEKMETTYISYVYEPLRDEDGNIDHVMVLANEVTDSVVARKKIEASESKFRNLVMQAPVGIAILKGKDFKVEIANEHYLQIANRTADELIGKAFFEVLPELRETPLRDFLTHVLDTGQPYFGSEFPVDFYRNSTLDRAYFNFVYQPWIENNEVVGVIAVVNEVSAIVKARQIAQELAVELEQRVHARTKALKISNEKLEASNRELEQFAYIASHDLQEPLRKIQTFSELLQQHIGDRPLVEKYINKIDSSATRMSVLIRDVLNYSRLSQSEDSFQQVDLNGLLENVKSDFELLIQETNATFRHGRLPVIKGGGLQLHQLFSNIIGNSLKFRNGDPVIDITWKALSAEEIEGYKTLISSRRYIRLTFTDNGIGFEQAYVEKIFVIFQRLNYSGKHDGTGIGLALCKKIVENHGGEIVAEGELNKGATFHVMLPVE